MFEQRKMNKFQILILYTGLCFFVFLNMAQFVFASDYYVETEFPENQSKTHQDYYSLLMKPGQKQTLTIQVYNDGDEEETFLFTVLNGSTTNYGAIDYIDTAPPILPIPLSTIVSVPKEEVIPAKSSKKINIDISMPQDPFLGIILGSLEVITKDKDVDPGDDKFVVSNKVRQLIPIQLRESFDPVDPDIELKEVHASNFEEKNAILFTIENTEPVIIDKFYVDAQVTKKGSDKVLYKQNRKDMQMAPNSSFNFPLFIGIEAFKAGKYTAHVTASADGGYEWDFEKDFEITREEANEFNRLSTLLSDDQSFKMIYIIIGIIILIVLIIIFMMVNNNKNKSTKKKQKKVKK